MDKRTSVMVIVVLTIALIGVALIEQSPAQEVHVESEVSPQVAGSPYYVLAETSIVGPQANLQLIKDKTGGVLGADYVEFSSYRIYVDNTFQLKSSTGTLSDMGAALYSSDDEKSNLQSKFNELVGQGAIHPSSYLSSVILFMGTPSTGWWTTWYYSLGGGTTDTITFITSDLRAVQLYGSGGWGYQIKLYLNGGVFLDTGSISGGWRSLRADVPYSNGTFQMYTQNEGVGHDVWITIYTGDLPTVSIAPKYSINVLNSPGTGYSWKTVSPGTVRPGGNMQVELSFDTQRALKANITECFPMSFSLVGNVLVEKYNPSGLVTSSSVTVIPKTIVDHKEFQVLCTDVSWLVSLESDTWIILKYTVNCPLQGTYTFLAGKIEYIPLTSSS